MEHSFSDGSKEGRKKNSNIAISTKEEEQIPHGEGTEKSRRLRKAEREKEEKQSQMTKHSNSKESFKK